MNTLGSLTLVLSGATVLLALLLSLLGMSLRMQRNLVRSLLLNLIDKQQGRRGRASLEKKTARSVLGVIRPFQRGVIRAFGLGSQATALDLARHALYANAGFVVIALAILAAQMTVTDLTSRYVVHTTNVDLPLFFRITGTWAGSSGSMLFWYCLLAVFSAIVVYQTRNRLFNRLPMLFFSLATLELLFVMLTLFFKDAQPFRAYPIAMQSGRGLNPLLLHWAMIIHPPMLYIGYVSFAVPFALMISSVVSGNMKDDYLPLLRRWTIFSWFFLGTGILLGSKWAYEELGWGGYWAWDPVENASLMPFLLATAFLHSLIVQERRGMLRFWNVVLITLGYHFCLLGTWITRSGILQGPHTFAESTIGIPLIVYIGISFVFYMRYLYFRRKALRPKETLEAVTSKEGSMLLNNFLMTLATLVVLFGVFSPLLPIDCSFDGGFTCHKAEWKLNTFNKIMVPIGILTLFLMGASPLLSWRKSADQIYARTLRIPIILGVIATVAAALLYRFAFTRIPGVDESSWGPGFVAEAMSVLTVGIAVFVVAGILQEYKQGIRSRRIRFNENILLASVRMILRNKRRYAGYLVHLSIVFLFVGYAGGSFKKTAHFDFQYYKMAPTADGKEIHYHSADRAYLEDYEVSAQDLFLRPVFRANADQANPIHLTISQEAHYYVRRGPKDRQPGPTPPGLTPYAAANRPFPPQERLLRLTTGFVMDGRMKTERHFHPQIDPSTGQLQRMEDGTTVRIPTSKPDIRSTWTEDFYIQLGAISDPMAKSNPDLNRRFEFYYYEMERDPAAYARFFPNMITATLEVWINPLTKFIWLGSLMFFLGGLIILIPYGERDLE